MNTSELAAVIDETMAKCKQLLVLKGGEYSGKDDRLENFKRAGRSLGLDPIVILMVYAGKHWDAISQYACDITAGVNRPRLETIDGRIDDLINYMFLLKGLICERNRTRVSPAFSAGLNPSLTPQSGTGSQSEPNT